MFDFDRLPVLKELIRNATFGDANLLQEVMDDVALLKQNVSTIQPRNTNRISLVASDGGNNRLVFNPFSLQVVRVVDTFGQELVLDVISPSSDTTTLGQRHLDEGTPLGRLMSDLNVTSLADLSPMIPARPKSQSWPLVFRDLCEWAALYDLITRQTWGGDTLIVRDGLLRAKIFRDDLFVQMYKKIKGAIEATRKTRRREIFLVGIAKRSRVIERYRLAMAVQNVFKSGYACYAPVPTSLQSKVYEWDEYVRSPEDADDGKENPKFNMGAMHLVRFGDRSGDPVWTVDILHCEADRAQQVFGSLLDDAQKGFPVPFYPHCLQEADRHAQVVDLDLAILQTSLEEAVREQIAADRRHVFDAQRLAAVDPAAVRYQ
ncbi:hypothetical protein GT755_07905 [Herbidospora sp. NEAU-GS84]|uniref:NurA domain-containing protein n=1 Tax=Herbidospora solisilvae TaxID=2696284 RepID=A0A7C9J196_9ACTN|nr:hypothetical protein [Herbidospora solisilvae]NAS21606.1 hypothetical protein [Herbidospora solisilvae]